MIKYVKALEGSGVKREQAEIQVQVMDEYMRENFSTKADLRLECADIRHTIKHEIGELRAEFMLSSERTINQLISKMIQIMGIVVAVLGLLIGISTAILGFK